MDIPLDDPEANRAAARIQAGFRGHMTRKQMKDVKPEGEGEGDGEEVSSSGEALNGNQGNAGQYPSGSSTLSEPLPHKDTLICRTLQSLRRFCFTEKNHKADSCIDFSEFEIYIYMRGFKGELAEED